MTLVPRESESPLAELVDCGKGYLNTGIRNARMEENSDKVFALRTPSRYFISIYRLPVYSDPFQRHTSPPSIIILPGISAKSRHYASPLGVLDQCTTLVRSQMNASCFDTKNPSSVSHADIKYELNESII